ncbi:MAG: hypothetical protein JNK02_01920 [Planctomycetes bacterium]|nr:hypothetical protein [Planctomycetota bacterium]
MWYFEHAYGRWEGPGTRPFYCDPDRVGRFAVDPADLSAGKPSALFRLFVALSMFQARRDTLIMAQQRAMPRTEVALLSSTATIRRAVRASPCERLRSAEAFDEGCNVRKSVDGASCGHRPSEPCHVKRATVSLRRMGDMGKLPTSAWLRLWEDGRFAARIRAVQERSSDPAARAEELVRLFESVHRVGRKLATMFVSALSTPALAPGLTPWFPTVDGNALVVIDTNVARVVDVLRASRAAGTYAARAEWVREQAERVDLRRYAVELPSYSPRIVQQALYTFASRSNRTARADPCSLGRTCAACVQIACPFAPRSPSGASGVAAGCAPAAGSRHRTSRSAQGSS